MQSTIVSLLALSTGVLARPSAPAPSHTFTCADSAEGFAWSMTDFEYNAIETSSTPAHQVVKGEVSFNISNPALLSVQSTSGCIAQSYKFPNYFYDSDVYYCVDPDSDSKTKTAFTFDSASGLLSINQSWTCPDTTETMSFIASGAVNLTLTTTPTVYSNPNWHVGETFHNSSKYSTALDGPIMAFQVDRVA